MEHVQRSFVPSSVQVLRGREFVSLSCVAAHLDGRAIEISGTVEDEATVRSRAIAWAEAVQDGFVPDGLVAARVLTRTTQAEDSAPATFDSSIEGGAVKIASGPNASAASSVTIRRCCSGTGREV